MCFPLHRTHTVIADWMPLSFAELELIIPSCPAITTKRFAFATSPLREHHFRRLPLNGFVIAVLLRQGVHLRELELLFKAH